MSNKVKIDILRILDEGNKWLRYLIRQRTYLAIENSIIAVLLYSILILMVSSTSSIASTELMIIGAMLAIPFAIISFYFFLKRRRIGEFEKWKKHIAELRQREIAPVESIEESAKTPYKGTLESALELMDQMTLWIQDMAKSRIGWAWRYGVLAFFLSEIIIMYFLGKFALSNLYFLVFPSSIAVGGLVWYVIRKKRKDEAERRIRMVHEWKSRIEKERNKFFEGF